MTPADFGKLSGSEPVYLQIVRRVRAEAASGRLKKGDTLPSRRELAAALGINPNTVQKAYRLLEDEGLLETAQSSHSVVTAGEAEVSALRSAEAGEAAREFSGRMKELGFELDEAFEILKDKWN